MTWDLSQSNEALKEKDEIQTSIMKKRVREPPTPLLAPHSSPSDSALVPVDVAPSQSRPRIAAILVIPAKAGHPPMFTFIQCIRKIKYSPRGPKMMVCDAPSRRNIQRARMRGCQKRCLSADRFCLFGR